MELFTQHRPAEKDTCRMRSSHSLDRLDIAFDGTQLVAGAGLLLPATLALHLGLKQLVERFLVAAPWLFSTRPNSARRSHNLLSTNSTFAGGQLVAAGALPRRRLCDMVGSPGAHSLHEPDHLSTRLRG